MGLPPPALRFLCREHRRRPIAGAVLTLGRQRLFCTPAELAALLRDEGIVPAAPVAAATDVAFFRALGATTVTALDVSPYEGAEVVHDLNEPVPAEFLGRFDLVVDGGTLEHVFDVRRGLVNAASLVAVGGRVLHLSPCSNYGEHGFWSISPTAYQDYYAANGWANPRGYVVEHDRAEARRPAWDLFAYRQGASVLLTSPKRLATLFLAERAPGATVDRVPTQGYYAALHGGGAPAPPPGGLARWRRRVGASPAGPLLRRLLGRDPTRRPWGLARLAHLR